MFVLTTLLGESTGSIMDPFVAIDLLTTRAAAAAAIVSDGAGRSSTVETTSGKNELAASRARRVIDD